MISRRFFLSLLCGALLLSLTGAAPHVPDRDYPCQVIDVTDGDTLDVSLSLGFDLTLTKPARLYGINCPEINTPEGKAAKAFTEQWVIEHKTFTFRAHRAGKEKYGRLLGTILSGQDSLNDALLKAGHAKRY